MGAVTQAVIRVGWVPNGRPAMLRPGARQAHSGQILKFFMSLSNALHAHDLSC